MSNLIYTTIIFSVRDRLSISNNEYILCDQIYNLSRSGWCKSKQSYLAHNLGVSDRGIRKMADRLIKIGLIEQSATGKYKTTDKWYNIAVLEKAEQSSTSENGNKVPKEAEQSSSKKRNKVPMKAEQSSSSKENKEKINKENKDKDINKENFDLEETRVLSDEEGQAKILAPAVKPFKGKVLEEKYDFNSMSFDDIAELLKNTNNGKLCSSVCMTGIVELKDFKGAVYVFLNFISASKQIEHQTESSIAAHFFAWIAKQDKDWLKQQIFNYIETEAKIKENEKLEIFRAYQAELRAKIQSRELREDKAIEMARAKKLELQIN